jgi:hypothetical protein
VLPRPTATSTSISLPDLVDVESNSHLQVLGAVPVRVVVIQICEECGRGYSHSRFVGDPDRHGSRPIQCPNCYAYLGRTRQGSES